MSAEPTITDRFESLEKRLSEVEALAARKHADNRRLLKESGEKDERIRSLEA